MGWMIEGLTVQGGMCLTSRASDLLSFTLACFCTRDGIIEK